MDFVDWRKIKDKTEADQEVKPRKLGRYRGKMYRDYIDELIREAEERGEFDNLPGAGKPLNIDENVYAGDKAMGYSLLKNNGHAPPEIELMREIKAERERAEAKLARVKSWSRALRTRRNPPTDADKRAFNAAVEKAATEYDEALRKLNRKILTLNLSVPTPMHQQMLNVERLVQEFRESCPLFVVYS